MKEKKWLGSTLPLTVEQIKANGWEGRVCDARGAALASIWESPKDPRYFFCQAFGTDGGVETKLSIAASAVGAQVDCLLQQIGFL